MEDDLKIVSATLEKGIKKIGYVTVQYKDLMYIQCDIVLWVKGEPKIWIRTPEVWFGAKKVRLFAWKTKEMSDEFQRIIISRLEADYGLTMKEAKRILKMRTPKQQKKKKNLDNIKEKI